MRFPEPREVFDKHFPDKRFSIGVRYRVNDGHDHDPDNYIGGIPRNTPFLSISLSSGSWRSEAWDHLKEAYENEGYNVHLRKSSGKTRTRSGSMRHASTTMYVWE